MPKSIEKCEQIRQQTRQKIIQDSVLFFARYGFAGTRISDLAKHIGIGQGTLYQYFASKEELYLEIHKIIGEDAENKKMKALLLLPISAAKKINRLSEYLLNRLKEDINFAGRVALNTQMLLEKDSDASMSNSTYQSELYDYMSKIIIQGQREGSVVSGSAIKLADYYWGVVYLYAMKQLFTKDYEMIHVQDLNRTVLIERMK